MPTTTVQPLRKMISSLARRAAVRVAGASSSLKEIHSRHQRLALQCVARAFASKMTNAAKPSSASNATIAEPTAGPDSDIPSIFDQATGVERAEIDYPDLFKHNEVLRGPFGTEENPVKIQSHYDNRIVGCTGRPSPDDHDIVWLQVEKGIKSCCPECGQFFVLDPL